jgi:hypothetical protein
MTFSINETRPHLELETGSLSASELSMGTLMREINLRNKPSRILQMLMGHLENKRMEKKLGWSRPWNKVGVTTFRTHKIRIQEDTRFLEKIRKTLMPVLVQIGENYLNFAREFLSDPNLMAFVFYHNRQQGLDWYEGVTLSFGRRVPSDRNKRDRIDLILEDKRENGKVDNLPDRIRIIVNPFSNWLKDEVSLSEFAHGKKLERFGMAFLMSPLSCMVLGKMNRIDSGNIGQYGISTILGPEAPSLSEAASLNWGSIHLVLARNSDKFVTFPQRFKINCISNIKKN